MLALLWFRRDLRLRDHPALAAAAANDEVLACFVLDRGWWPRRVSGACNFWATRCDNCATG
jgi:deoxyribodipyrimidine photolyase